MPSEAIPLVLALVGLALVVGAIVWAYRAGRRAGTEVAAARVALAQDAAEDLERDLERERAQAAADLEAERAARAETDRRFRRFAQLASTSADFRNSLARIADRGPDAAFGWLLDQYPEAEAEATDPGPEAPPA